MSYFYVPDVRQMYESLFPGGEVVGEAIGLLRDCYLFLQERLSPSDGGRAIVLAFMSLAMTGCIMMQRRVGNVRSIYLIVLAALSRHGAMFSLFGLPWFVFPLLDYFLQNGNSSAVMMIMSVLSMVVGWGRHCLSEGATLRQTMGLELGYEVLPAPGPWWGILLFGCLAAGVALCLWYEFVVML